MLLRNFLATLTAAAGILFINASVSHADIFRWDSGELIPGTEGIESGPGAPLDRMDLQYADLGERDLTGANFELSSLNNASLQDSTLIDANLTGANLANAFLNSSTLIDANLAGAVVTDTDFSITVSNGFTKEQLYSTASYWQKNLRGIVFGCEGGSGAGDVGCSLQTREDLSGWDFRGQDLTNAVFESVRLSDADFTDAIVTSASFSSSPFSDVGSFTKEQLYSTTSYKQKYLPGIYVGGGDFSGGDFTGQNLANTKFAGSTLANAQFAQANLANAHLEFSQGLSSASFDAATVYDQRTVFPPDFDPVAAGLTFVTPSRGDFNADGAIDALDVGLLAGLARKNYLPGWHRYLRDVFDLNGDFKVNNDDHRVWIHDIKQTWFGDANLDGVFNSSDLVTVLAAGEYEDDITGNSGWASGDWNADGDFTTNDLVLALADGGYEQGRRPVVAVPEPRSLALMLVPLLIIEVRLRLRHGARRTPVALARGLAMATVFSVAVGSANGQGFSEIVVFGDSLSDSGNIFQRDGIPVSPPYYEGRVSNGPVWIDHLADRLELPRPSASTTGGTNFAWGGATTGSVRSNFVPDMDRQITVYLKSNTPQPSQLYVLWGGTNDFNRGQLNGGAAATSLLAGIRGLVEGGAQYVLVANLPDRLGEIVLGDFATAFNEALSAGMAELRNEFSSADLVEFDDFEFQRIIELNPDVFALTEVRRPACRDCSFGEALNPTRIAENPDAFMFWDRIHPSARTHQLMGDAVWNTLLEPAGDFDQDGALGSGDIDLLQAAIQKGSDEIAFESDRDWILDADDLGHWVRSQRTTWFGDANLDGEFNTTDLVTVLANGEYEDDVAGNSSWTTGDWNADGEFTTGDLVVALGDGGYERGPRPAAIPEPAGIRLLALGTLSLCFYWRAVSEYNYRRTRLPEQLKQEIEANTPRVRRGTTRAHTWPQHTMAGLSRRLLAVEALDVACRHRRHNPGRPLTEQCCAQDPGAPAEEPAAPSDSHNPGLRRSARGTRDAIRLGFRPQAATGKRSTNRDASQACDLGHRRDGWDRCQRRWQDRRRT